MTCPHNPHAAMLRRALPSPTLHALSARLHELQRIRQNVQEAPDIRAERVAAARQALHNGTLALNAYDLAGYLLKHLAHVRPAA